MCQIKHLQMSYLICGWIGQADSLGVIGLIEILVTLSELQICTVCLISWHWSPVLERLQVASREGHQDNFQICGSSRYRQHLHFQFQKQNLKLSNVNLKGASASASYRLERWSNFDGDAIAMVFLFKRCDTNVQNTHYDRFWCDYLDLTIVADGFWCYGFSRLLVGFPDFSSF